MSRTASRVLFTVPVLLALLGGWTLLAWSPPVKRRVELPAVVAWSWDRAEDLSFLDANSGVALVVASIEFEGTELHVRARHTTLTLPQGAAVLPVVHVDALSRWKPALNVAQESGLVRVIVEAARRSAVDAVQVDFEALPSQRDFYRRVLQRVRAELPDTYLSVTALASWCMGDHWLNDAPVDEVVAMAFRMGPESANYRNAISHLADWPAPQCSSTGVATDEPTLTTPAHERLYLFSPRPWTYQRWGHALASYTSNKNHQNETTQP